VVRSTYGAALMRLARIDFAVANYDDATAMRAALNGCDVVVDLTYPGGQFPDIPPALARNLRAVMAAMVPGSRYVHMSSIMAFGMSSGDSTLKNHRLPRVSYGHIKRWGEGEAERVGAGLGIETYVMRLGQVHGALQSVSQEYRRRTEAGRLRFEGSPDALSTTLFTNAVADAIRACGRGALQPGRTYTLLSNPQWSLSELGSAYGELFNPTVEVSYAAPKARSSTAWAIVKQVAGGSSARDLLETYVLMRTPGLFVRAKGKYRARSVRTEAAAISGPAETALPCLTGVAPDLVPDIDSSVPTTVRTQRSLARRLDAVLRAARREG
jgi:uncharacterized protein YbjT (DUF2867 family)